MKPGWYSQRIFKATTNDQRDAVRYVQRVLGCKETGEIDESTASHIRGFQVLFGLHPSGFIDDATAEQINNVFPEGA